MTHATNTSSAETGGAAPKIILPDDVRDTVRTFAKASSQVHRSLAYALLGFLDEFNHYGQKMIFYDLIAAEWNDATGDHVTPRTVRHWIHSVTDYTALELREFSALSDAMLITAVQVGNDCQKPPDILRWAIANQIESVPALMAHWLPQTSTEYEIDPGWLAGLKRAANKRFAPQDERWPRINALFGELRELLK